MRRRLVKFGVFLLLGAAVNVAVAWALMFGTSNGGFESEDGAWSTWPCGAPQEWPAPDFVDDGRATGFRYATATRNRTTETEESLRSESWFAVRIDVGWPMLGISSLECSHEHSEPISPPTATPWCALASNGPSRWPPRSVPWIPQWPGFAINTAFYAAACWLLFVAPSAFRRRMRIRRGQCPHCSYPVGTSHVCTECGAAVKPKPVEVMA